MESSKNFFCHTCSKQFQKLVLNQDEDVQCPTCNEFFVELLEYENQLDQIIINPAVQAQTQQTTEKSSIQRKSSKVSDDDFYDCVDAETRDKIKIQNNESQEEEKKEEQPVGSNNNGGKEEEKKEQIPNQQQQQQTSFPQTSQNSQQIPQFGQIPFNNGQSQAFTTQNGNTTIHTQVHNINLNANGQNQDWIQNLSTQINDLMRSQGAQTTQLNQNGQNINVTSVNGVVGDADINITNIESQIIGGGEEGEDGEEDYDMGEYGDEGADQIQLQIDIQNVIEDPIMQEYQQPNAQQNQQQQQVPNNQNVPNGQPNQQQQQQQPFQNLLQSLLGGGNFMMNPQPGNANGQGPNQVFTQVFNFGGPQGAPVGGVAGGPNPFQNILGGFNINNMGMNFQQQEQNILNQVLQQSLDQALNQQRLTPTSKTFIEKLRTLRGSDLMNKQECEVCFDPFKDEDQILQLPCKHLYHKACILPWLEKHNTCPTCRHELPTDDLEYESRRQNPTNGTNGGDTQNPINQLFYYS